ncbi:hypothetical protein ABZ686_31795, partial [Streptomyces sp. NPDC006992]
LIGNAVHALLTHPEQLHLVREAKASWDDVSRPGRTPRPYAAACDGPRRALRAPPEGASR